MFGFAANRLRFMKAVVVVGFAALALAGLPAAESGATQAPKTAFLGIEFLNDNAGLEPTSNAEHKRMQMVEEIFKEKLKEAGLYSFIDLPRQMQDRIEKGQPIGECGGCEISYGKELGVEHIAWIRIQKVSNLILNMNVYIANVETEKMTFVRSVDIRGNTDETWAHSIKWLIKRYVVPSDKEA